MRKDDISKFLQYLLPNQTIKLLHLLMNNTRETLNEGVTSKISIRISSCNELLPPFSLVVAVVGAKNGGVDQVQKHFKTTLNNEIGRYVILVFN